MSPPFGVWHKNDEIAPPMVALTKNFFYNIFSISTKEFKIGFQNRKWNYPNRKWNYFSHFQASDEKTTFITFSPYQPKNSNWIFKTGNGIIQTGNGIISPTSCPLIKNFFYWMFLIWSKGVKINFWNRKWNYANRKWNYFSYFLTSDQKNYFTKSF